ncbi:hypothetical protein JCM16358_05900 [Halanaerocella petrolearia]
MNKHKQTRLIINLTFLVTQFITIFLLSKDGRLKYDGVIASTLFFAIYTIIEIKYNLYLNNYIRSISIITIIAHSILGRYLKLYKITSYFDILLHAFGTYSFTLFSYSLITELLPTILKQKHYKTIFIITLGISLGTIFEIIEFSLDIMLNQTLKHQEGLTDTNTDLISDISGAIIASFHLKLLKIKKTAKEKN